MTKKTNLATTCTLCSHTCGLRVDVQDNRITEIVADKSNPLSRGYSCNKGYSVGHMVEHSKRLHFPMKKASDGSHYRITWEQAYSEIGEKLKNILKHNPPRSVAIAGIGGPTNHLAGFASDPFMGKIGTQWIFNALAQEKSQHGLVNDWMFNASSLTTLLPDDEKCDYLIIMGSNPLISNRGLNASDTLREIQNDPNRKLVIVDPMRTETARIADIHIPIKPAGDSYFLMAILVSLIRHNLVNTEFIRKNTLGYTQVKAKFFALDLKELSSRCNVSIEQIEGVTRGMAAAKSAAIMLELGVEHSRFSTLTSYLVRLIAALTGNIGNSGGLVFKESMMPPALDTRSQKPPNALVSGIPGIYYALPNPIYSPSLFAEEILTSSSERIRAVFVDGSNPAVQYAETKKVHEALNALELLVVIDPAFTETAKFADYVLPTQVSYEKWDYSIFQLGYPGIFSQLRPPVLRGPGESLPESEIYINISKAAGLLQPPPAFLYKLAKRHDTPWGSFIYIFALFVASLSKHTNPIKIKANLFQWLYETLGPLLPSPTMAPMWLMSFLFAGLSKKALISKFPEMKKGNLFSRGLELYKKIMSHPEGLFIGRLDTNANLKDHIRFKRKKIRLAIQPMLSEVDRALSFNMSRDPQYPFILEGGKRAHWTINSVLPDPGWRKGRGPHCYLLIHPEDARQVGVKDTEAVIIETKTGRVETVTKVDSNVQKGHVHLPNGFGMRYTPPGSKRPIQDGVLINSMTDAQDRDPFTGCPHYKYIECRVQPAQKTQVLESQTEEEIQRTTVAALDGN